jgi:hypothetical protein
LIFQVAMVKGNFIFPYNGGCLPVSYNFFQV